MTRASHILWTLLILALLGGIFAVGWNVRPLPTCACWCDEPVVKVQPVNKRVFDSTRRVR